MTATTRGRRPGGPDTRAQILAAARELFAERGFARTSVRAVAAQAGVDPSLVHHYFGSKDDLLLASLEMPVDPRELMVPVVAAGADAAGEGLLRAFLGAWDDPALQPVLLGALRRLLEPGGESLLTEGFVPGVLLPLGRALGIDRPELRMPLLASQVLGLILSRYVLRLEPVCSLSADAVVAAYAPTLQRYLTGDVGDAVP